MNYQTLNTAYGFMESYNENDLIKKDIIIYSPGGVACTVLFKHILDNNNILINDTIDKDRLKHVHIQHKHQHKHQYEIAGNLGLRHNDYASNLLDTPGIESHVG